jgi:hypothetical protein
VRLGMKHVLVSFCLTLAAVFAPTTPYLNLADAAIRATCIPSAEIAVATSDQHEVHALVVDMPQRASLEYASPESWGTLPTIDPPNEESPTKPALQVALN